ncbi:MAG TPA: hypothetical protein PLC80_11865 [Draconibacterium sp.]|nr:hypothetical protein [Draconibacterium sp.]
METNLEHKVAEAYKKQDASTNYQNKDELWKRISNTRNSGLPVNGFWRIAAVLLAIFFITGAFSAILFINYNKSRIALLENKNYDLQVLVDSLQFAEKQIVTKIEYVEKEKPVYIRVEKKSTLTEAENEEIGKLKSKIILQTKQFELETKNLQIKTDSLLNEIIALNIALGNKTNSIQSEKHGQPNFIELKSEKYEMPLQQNSQTANPKMKLQLFSSPNEKTNFDMNSTIFKK